MHIFGTGSYVPHRTVANEELTEFLDTSDEWIVQRTGIHTRHVASGPQETASQMGIQAALAALENSGIAANELDLILAHTVSGDYACPPIACVIQQGIGATCPAMDVNAACSGFLYMLESARAWMSIGKKKILLVAAEQLSRVADWTDRASCVLVGDGAGAVVVGPGDGYLASHLYAQGDAETIAIPTHIGISPFYEGEQAKPFFYMNGQTTFRFAVNRFCQDAEAVLNAAGLTAADVTWMLPHQANRRIIDAAGKRLGIPPERYCGNISKYGNTSSACIPLMLDEWNRTGRLRRGDVLLMVAFGGGLTSAAYLLRW